MIDELSRFCDNLKQHHLISELSRGATGRLKRRMFNLIVKIARGDELKHEVKRKRK